MVGSTDLLNLSGGETPDVVDVESLFIHISVRLEPLCGLGHNSIGTTQGNVPAFCNEKSAHWLSFVMYMSQHQI